MGYLHQISNILWPEQHEWDQYQRVNHDHKIVHEEFEIVPKLVGRFVKYRHQYDAANEQNFIIAGHHPFFLRWKFSAATGHYITSHFLFLLVAHPTTHRHHCLIIELKPIWHGGNCDTKQRPRPNPNRFFRSDYANCLTDDWRLDFQHNVGAGTYYYVSGNPLGASMHQQKRS